MKLIFDLTKTQPIGDSKFHGGGKYGEIVFNALVEHSKDVVAYYNFSKWLNPQVVDACEKNSIEMFDANLISIKELAEKYKGVIYSPLLDKNIDSFGEVTYICTIHGLRTLEMPFDSYIGRYRNSRFQLLYRWYGYWQSKRTYSKELIRYRELCNKKNVKIITVSEHSRASILSFISIPEVANIKVFYSPSTISSTFVKKCENKKVKEKYYLLVSAHRWVKNTLRAVLAFDEIFSDFPDFEGKVVITGVKDKAIFNRDLRNPERFKFLNYVEEDELIELYNEAFLFVYPSLNEGFGYPPLEAMAHGTPVIASAISSIPEVCGDAVLYFDPHLVSEMKMRILQMENVVTYQKYSEKAIARVKIIEKKQHEDLRDFVNYLLSFIKKH
ncbi:MAG: glycosyltransferase family 1 protein [Flavobacterium sp.]|nr:MAG: glycosyltransferase family 1 protein [Flavobacterium sp.]